MKLFRDLSPLEMETFKLHLLASAFEGSAFAVWWMHDFFLKKTLHGANWQVWILVSLWPVANLTSVYFAGKAERGRGLKPYLAAAALLGRLPLVLMAFASTIPVFLALHALYSLSFAVAKPAQTAILQANYREGRRGELFSWAWTVTVALGGIGSLGVGALLDRFPGIYHLLLPMEGVLGACYCLVLAAIPLASRPAPPPCQSSGGLREATARTIRVFKENPSYFRFQVNFMIYGLAFMVVLPAVPVLATKKLGLDYTSFALARGILGPGIALLCMPWFGRKMDRIGPLRASAAAFTFFGFYPLFLGISPWLGTPFHSFWFFAGFVFYGIAMGGLMVIWHMGSIYYAPPGMTATYQGIHVTMTGLRGLVGPLAGYLLLTYTGISAPFALSVLLFFTAAFLMRRQYLSEKVQTLPDQKSQAMSRK